MKPLLLFDWLNFHFLLSNLFTHWYYCRSQGRKKEPVQVSPLLPPPPPPMIQTYKETGAVDYLSGDTYRSERPYSPPLNNNSNNTNSNSNSLRSQPIYDEPNSLNKRGEGLISAPWDSPQSTPFSIPPPPSKYNQRQQFFEQKHVSPNNTSPMSSGSGSSYDSLVGSTRNLSLQPSAPTRQQSKPEDALFKDLVDFAKSKTSSSSSKPNRSFWRLVYIQRVWIIWSGRDFYECC